MSSRICAAKAWTRTKIVCTLGPATDAPGVLENLIAAGMDVARVNLSHGTLEEQAQRIRAVREASRGLVRPVAILADLPGPKWRIGALVDSSRRLRDGEPVSLVAHAKARQDLPVPHPDLLAALRPGDEVYLADGAVRLRVLEAKSERVECCVMAGGPVRGGSGINVPEVDLPAMVPTARDRECLAFATSQGADWVGVSFVQDPDDLQRVRELLPRGDSPRLMAKIEKRRALRELAAIIEAADGVMVARGDLGVETELAEIPLLQKRIIAAANAAARPVVTATQMLESMVTHERPTRAEVSDVANAVLDGTGCVMLSAESAVGRHPVRAAQFLRRIAMATESGGQTVSEEASYSGDPLAFAACRLAEHLGARAILVQARSLRDAAELARFHPRVPIVALAASEHVWRATAMVAGVSSLRAASEQEAAGWLYSRALARPGDQAVAVCGPDTIRTIRLA